MSTLAEAIAANTPKHWPGAIECETLNVVAKSGDFRANEQNMDLFDAKRWSGGAQLLVVPKTVGDYVELRLPAPDDVPPGNSALRHQSAGLWTLQFSINGQTVPGIFDGYAKDVPPAAPVNLGTFAPQNGAFILRAEVAGANSASINGKYLFGLDCLVLKKL